MFVRDCNCVVRELWVQAEETVNYLNVTMEEILLYLSAFTRQYEYKKYDILTFTISIMIYGKSAAKVWINLIACAV
jgi:hypothetical protein